LGADVCNITKNKIDKSPLRLIYVGTFNGRRLYDTIAGLALFLRKHPVTVSYQIIGRGNDEEELKLKESIEQFGLQDSVSLLGYVRNDELSHYCLSSHIGVSYVPITTAYDNQPPTKTFEYWGFGLPVIATATTAHRDIVTSQNGLLVQDTPASFAEGLEQIVVNLDTFDERIIKNSFKQYTWTVINKNFLDYVKEI
jgi:glycosyltransferase involved in cell wall biosynthesis